MHAGHELKATVAALVLLAEAMRTEEDPAALHRLADRLIFETHRTESMLEDVLELGGTELRASARRQRIAVRDIVHDALDRVGPAATARDALLNVNEGPSHLSLFGSRRLLSSALANLLDNGVKYSPPHARVRLRVERRLGWIELTVTDEGIGIPRAEIPRVFERFYRGAAARSFSGSGLGLAIVREVVSDHGGDVSVHSVEGVGSTFTLRLPLAMSSIPVPPDGLARARK